MAEARAAVKLAAVDTREFSSKSQHPSESDVNKAFFIQWKNYGIKKFHRLKIQVQNGLWPTTFYNLKVAFLCIFGYLIVDPNFSRPVTDFLWNIGKIFAIDERMPFYLRALLLSILVSFLFFVVLLHARRYLLRALLAYRGWMYTTPNSRTNVKTLSWCAAVRVISGLAQPTLFSCQLSLPRMPVPPLKDTMDRVFKSLDPLYKSKREDYERLRKEADEFVNGPGKRLQRILKLKSWWAPNYVSDWWEKYVYLRSRSPLPINSNYYMLASPTWVPTCKPCSRAAVLTAGYMAFKNQIDHESLTPLLIHGAVPLCMAQYERIFSSARLPGDEFDEIALYRDSRHIVICYKHCWFKVDVVDMDGNPIKAKALESTFESIVREVDASPIDPLSEEAMIPALTALDRQRWAVARRQLMASSEASRYALQSIESAAFAIVLEHRSFADFRARAEYLIHGDGRTLWFDKTIEVVIFADGHMGLNVEHTPADAPVVGHLNEIFMGSEIADKLYDERTGAVFDVTRAGLQARPPKAERLEFVLGSDQPKADIPDEPKSDTSVALGSLRSTVKYAYEFAVRNNNELSLQLLDHDIFGKGAMKKCRVSPDSFVQMALQLAFLRDQKRLALTYESSMTRLYLQGRTETIRSLTPEAYAFLMAVDDPNVSIEKKQNLMQNACNVHQKLSRDAMNGLGCDRHLFALYVCARGLGLELPFLTEVLTLPWTLSTSQTPMQQVTFGLVDPDIPYLHDKLSFGGGFGPVSDDGYGVAYLFAGEHRVFFHISSKQKQGKISDSAKTDSTRFGKRIFAAMSDLRALFDPPKSQETKTTELMK